MLTMTKPVTTRDNAPSQAQPAGTVDQSSSLEPVSSAISPEDKLATDPSDTLLLLREPLPSSPFFSFRRYAQRDAEILRLRDAGWTQVALGRRYGLSRTGIWSVLWRASGREDHSPLLGLSVRVSNVLRFGILDANGQRVPLTLSALAACPYDRLAAISGIGRVAVLEIAFVLRNYGLRLEGLPPALSRELDALRPGSRVRASVKTKIT